MSTICPTNFATGILSVGDSFNDILTPEEILNLSDPTKTLDSSSLLAATKILNDKLNEMKQQKVPAVETFDSFKDEYPNIADRITAADGTGGKGNLNNISPSEVAIFVTETGAALDNNSVLPGQLTVDVSSWNPGSKMPAQVADTLEQMDNFFNDNIGSSLSGGECAAFAAALGALDALLDKVDGIATSLNDIPALDLDKYSLKELASGAFLKTKLALQSIGGIIKDTVSKVFGKITSQAASLLKKAIDLPAAAMRQVEKAYRKVTDFVNDKNKGSLMDGIDKMIAGVSSFFEKFNLDVLARLMFRLCQVASAIQNAAEAPMKSMINLMDGLTGANKVLKSDSAQHTKNAVAAGATRMPSEEVDVKIEEYQEKQRSLSGKIDDMAKAYTDWALSSWDAYLDESVETPNLSDLLPYSLEKTFPKVRRKKDLPKALREHVDTLKTDKTITSGVGPIKFDSSGFKSDYMQTTVRKGGDDTGEPGPAWTYVKTRLWCQALSIADQLGEDITVAQGFYWSKKTDNTARKGDRLVIKIPTRTCYDYVRYLIAASRAGCKMIMIGEQQDQDVLMISNSKGRKFYYAGQVWDDFELAMKTGLANSVERVEALKNDLGQQLQAARGVHLTNYWGNRYAVESGATGDAGIANDPETDPSANTSTATNPGDGSDANPPKTDALANTGVTDTGVTVANSSIGEISDEENAEIDAALEANNVGNLQTSETAEVFNNAEEGIPVKVDVKVNEQGQYEVTANNITTGADPEPLSSSVYTDDPYADPMADPTTYVVESSVETEAANAQKLINELEGTEIPAGQVTEEEVKIKAQELGIIVDPALIKQVQEQVNNGTYVASPEITAAQESLSPYDVYGTFSEAFNAAYNEIGEGGTFTWRGNEYLLQRANQLHK